MIAVSVLNGTQGGSRTHKTLILNQVPMPIRLLGHNIEKPLASHRPVVDLLNQLIRQSLVRFSLRDIKDLKPCSCGP